MRSSREIDDELRLCERVYIIYMSRKIARMTRMIRAVMANYRSMYRREESHRDSWT